jgi:hypothetical protein
MLPGSQHVEDDAISWGLSSGDDCRLLLQRSGGSLAVLVCCQVYPCGLLANMPLTTTAMRVWCDREEGWGGGRTPQRLATQHS